jgi:hypothetical protein
MTSLRSLENLGVLLNSCRSECGSQAAQHQGRIYGYEPSSKQGTVTEKEQLLNLIKPGR